MKKRMLKGAGCFLLSAAMAAGMLQGSLISGGSVRAEEPEHVCDNLKLWYDEPAQADVYEIFASRKWSFAWSSDGVLLGDDNLEIGRNDKYNYTDGKTKSKVSTPPISLGGSSWDVTDAARQGVTWAKHALPVGNGSMGAMSFGYIDTEIIQMNEETLWTGGPGSEKNMAASNDGDIYGNKNIANPAANMNALVDNAFAEFYKGLASGGELDNSKATPFSSQNKSSNATGLTPNARAQEGAYQSFCEMKIDYNQDIGKAQNYVRALDLNKAISTVSYEYGGVTYGSELFASYPDDVMVYKITASDKGKVNFTLHPEIPQMGIFEGRYLDTSEGYGKEKYGKTGTVTAEGDTITLQGELKHNGMKFAGQFKVIPSGGSMTADNETENALLADGSGTQGSITVKDADEAYIVVSLTTDYVNDFDSGYSTKETAQQLVDRMEQKVERAAEKGYERLLNNHEADYRELFDRVRLDLGEDFPKDVPTDELLDAYKANYNKNGAAQNYSKYLEVLYYQYGRYMLIASSREGSLPANLQGIWNDTDGPAWNSDWHTNINLQMNYWLAESTNLSETATALVDYANSLRKPGRLSLAKMYGIGYDADESKIDLETEDGFTFNCSTTARGFTGNIDSTAAFAPTAVAFLSQNLYDYYAYTQDKDYLKSDIYPYLREACITYLQTLKSGRGDSDAGKLYVVPSYSSEQGQWTVGTYFDQQLVWQLFHDTIEAMEELGIAESTTMEDEGEKTFLNDDGKLLARLKDAIGRLDPVVIGEEGQIKEWQHEKKYNRTAGGSGIGADNHRHISQLVALYPGNYITKDKEELIKASQFVLTKRTDTSTGWGLAHRLNLWARTGDGNHSYKLINSLLGTSTYDNLFDTHAPFQIDGNFGATAGMTEMLLQSHSGKVELLPALPDAWVDGNVEGIVARGNFEVDMQWKDGTAKYASVTSNAGGKLVLSGIDNAVVKDAEGKTIEASKNADGDYELDTEAGKTYTFTADGYVPEDVPKPKPLPSADPKQSAEPITSASPKPSKTPDSSELPDGSQAPEQSILPFPSGAVSSDKPIGSAAPDFILGDVDGNKKIELKDAQLALKKALNLIELSETQMKAADVDGKAGVSLHDAQLILKKALNLIKDFE